MNGKKAKLARKKAKELCKIPTFMGKENTILKALKKAVIAGVLSVLFVFNCHADKLIVPSGGILPVEFQEKMSEKGLGIAYTTIEVTDKTFAFCEYQGTQYVINTLKPVTEEQLNTITRLWGNNG